MQELSVKECYLVSGSGSCSCSGRGKKVQVSSSDICRSLCCQDQRSFFYYKKWGIEQQLNCHSSTMEIVRKRLTQLSQQVAMTSSMH